MLGEGFQQLYVFGAVLAFSALLTVVYLFVVGVLRNKIATIVFDALYGLLSAVALWWLNLTLNNGEFRLFVVIAIVLGVVITSALCKSTLDKLSQALYNLTTSHKAVNDNGTAVLQEENLNTDSGGIRSGSAASVHAADNADSTDKP